LRVDADGQAILGLGLGQVRDRQRHVDAAAHHRSSDHEDQQQHEYDVDERRDVDLAEHRRAALRTQPAIRGGGTRAARSRASGCLHTK
jgi:hypothetical protein